MAKYIQVVLRLPSPLQKLILVAAMILDALTNNPRFQNVPMLTALAAAIQQANKVLGKGTRAERLAAKEALKEILNHLADYVQGVAETQSGSVDLAAIQALIESASMNMRKQGAHPKLTFAAASDTTPGSVVLTAPASRKRDSHEWAVSTDQHTWNGLPSTRQATTRVTGLPIGMAHYFRHRLLTKDGYTEWSDPIMIMVK